jgi:hypothetical protein
MRLEAAAEAVETPEDADEDSLYLGSQAGRREPLLGSEDHTVPPTVFEKEGKKEERNRQRSEAERGNTKEKERQQLKRAS